MKYRIKAIESPDGSYMYFPQKKLLFFWIYFEEKLDKKVSFNNIIQAKKFIEYYKRKKKKEHIRHIEVKDD